MKVICLLCDSLNRHFLSFYGKGSSDLDIKLAETPHLDRFAENASVFEKHFSGSLPTMPTRRELWTGKYEFLWRPWGALEPWDRELPRIIRRNGILSMLITDSYHLFESGSGNYHFGFDGWEFFRGFEGDAWVTEPAEIPEHKGQLNARYVRNMRRMTQEEDLPPAKTLRCVERWLQKNHERDSFFLMIDEFAPHEPFNTPKYLVDRYDPDYEGPLFFWPEYGKDLYDRRDLRHLRAAYAAHVTLVDKYIGRVFETMTDLDMWKDTAVILMTDHGHFLGEHGYTGKPNCPPYNTLAHIPLLIHVPGHEGGKRIKGLSANIDLFPTILDLFGLEPESAIHGRSLLPLIRGDKENVRDWTLYGYFGRHVNITDGVHTYLRAPSAAEDAELAVYSLRWEFGMWNRLRLDDSLELGRFMPDVDMPVGRLPIPADMLTRKGHELENRLYALGMDPEQKKDLSDSQLEGEYEAMLRDALEEIGCPKEQFHRLGLDKRS